MTKKQIIVVATLALAAIVIVVGLPAFIRTRTTSATNGCINNLRQIDGAKQQWELEYSKTNNTVVTWNDIRTYIGPGLEGEIPKCPNGGTYVLGKIGDKPTCSCGMLLP